MEKLWVVCGFTCRKWSYAIGSNMLTRYRGLGQFNTAIEYHRRHLEITQEKGDNENIGNFYLSLGQFKRAIEFHVN